MMRNIKCVFRRKHLFRMTFGLLFLIVPFILGAQSLWEGSATVGAYGVLPVRGLYGASNSFPRNTLVEIENLENGSRAEIIIVDRLQNSSFLVLLSQEAGEELQIGPTGVIRVRATLGEADKTDSYSLNTDQVYSSDPDINPAAAAEYSATDQADTDDILALSVFPVETAVEPFAAEAAKGIVAAESVTTEPEPEPLPEVEVAETEAIIPDEPAEPEIVEAVEIDDTDDTAEILSIEVEEPEVKVSEKESKPEGFKGDPIVDVAGETIETIAEEDTPEAPTEIVMNEVAVPEVAPADEPEEIPELEPVEYEYAAEPVLTYVSGDMPEPDLSPEGSSVADLDIPWLTEETPIEQEAEEVIVSSFPIVQPDVEIAGALFTTQLPQEPEIIRGSGDAALAQEDIPVAESMTFMDLPGEEPLPAPILPVIMESRGGVEVAELTREDDAVMLVESGYLAPGRQIDNMEISHFPNAPVDGRLADENPGEDEMPEFINGYTVPSMSEEYFFAELALPFEPSLSSSLENGDDSDETPVLISGLMTPNIDLLDRNIRPALPDDPSAVEVAEVLETETPVAVNGFMEPAADERVRFADVDLPSAPEEDIPEPINGFMSPGSVDSAEFALASAPEEPKAIEEETPDAFDGYLTPESEEVGELAAADEPVIGAAEEEVAEKIEIEVPVYEGEVEITLEPAEDRPPEILDIPDVVESEGAEVVVVDDGPDEIVAVDEPVEPEMLPSLTVILGEDDGDADTDTDTDVDVEIEVEVEVVLLPGEEEVVVDVVEVVKAPELSDAQVPAPVVATLEEGFHYIQVGVYGDQVGASSAVNKLKGWSPVPVVVWTPETTDRRFKVMVGPLTPDESGVMLYNLKGKGYRDAFLRKVVEAN
ncbi:MAG: hypothetical protein JEY99_06920 [Spirochaetales bacterium]|nr:hypothetical protein [Spirochaetales bacterium]